ncbi:MAG: c-type cytochrome [Terracidiphilus sp.]
MKPSSVSLPVAVTALLTAAIFAVTTVAQTPQVPATPTPATSAPATPAPAAARPAEHHDHPRTPPTNLQVLPKNLTGDQVHEIMETWEAYLGVHCSTCHAADPKNIGPNGRPRLNYADDSKPEKATARLMYKMTEDINVNYVSKVPSSEVPVTCGTCHRGHFGPEPFVIPPDDDHGPRPQQAQPPSGTTTPHTN